ncbi:serine hydrolase [Paenibacillus sp. 453mf]|uniref:serine hydrolase n=1 Tax=Paenibacillus sp. 453mf TaxID=1761874 RepID=UPI0008EA34B5|nr:serine hydrolase [Paenibacillus sp. 453mf]SFS69251.1 CubicO group peptidase, beta-lactamase class C family [Paenibacillus sp. 453mf]
MIRFSTNVHKNSMLNRTLSAILVTSALLTQTIGVSQAQAASVATKPASITVDSQSVTWEYAPFVEKGTTYAPLRQAASALGGQVKWNQAKQTVEIYDHGDTITHRAGTNVIQINDDRLMLPAPSKNMSGTLMIPLRSLSDAMKAGLQLTNTPTKMIITLKSDSSTIINRESTAIDQYLKEAGYSGIALVASNGDIRLRKGYGLSDINSLVRPDQKSHIASITKGFTAAAIMQQVQQGNISLEDPVSKYVSGIDRGNEITIHMLLSHTSGLPSNFTRKEGITMEYTLAEIRTKKLMAEPGAEYRYSNNGYILLAAILEEISGKEYGAYLQEHFFKPIGMKDTGTATPSTKTIKGYTDQNGTWAEASYYVSQSGTGTLYSTVDDLLKWDQALRGDKVLSEEIQETMYSPYSDQNYGYGWIVSETEEGTVVFHNGSGTGYSTGISRNLDNGITVILLGNHAGMEMTGMLDQIQEMALKL